MTDSQPRPGACPRCGVPVTGAFKFCPACAYRLQPADIPPIEPPASRDRWLHALVLGVLGVFAVGVAIFGFLVFSDDLDSPETIPQPEAQDRRLTVQDDLNVSTGFEWLPGGADAVIIQLPWYYEEKEEGEEEEEPEEPPRDPVNLPLRVTDPLNMQRYEVTRGMYDEYVRALRADPSEIPLFLKRVWRPEKVDDREAQRYAEFYVDEWWQRLKDHQESLGRNDIVRPRDLAVPIPEKYDTWLIVPPSWVEVTIHGELRMREPEAAPDSDTIVENLPVTDVSWYDAAAFAAWASDLLGYKDDERLRLPTYTEWIRVARGGDLERTYPWGNYPHRYACNNTGRWRDGKPRPLPVDFDEYSDAEDRTQEGGGKGVWVMAGNVREWVLNEPWLYAKMDPLTELPKKDPEKMREAHFPRAPALGGSYLEYIEDCTVESVTYPLKWERSQDMGFRLVTSGSPLGG